MEKTVMGVVAMLQLASPAMAQASDPPLLAAVKRFCIQTGADPAGIAAAAEAAGGKKTASGHWQVSEGGIVFVLTAAAANGSGTCTLARAGNDAEGMAAIRAFIGVAMDDDAPSNPRLSQFLYADSDGLHSVPMTREAFANATAQGWIWQGALRRDGNGVSVELRHRLGPPPP